MRKRPAECFDHRTRVERSEMNDADYASLVAAQRAYFLGGNTRAVAWRVEHLNAIRTMIDERRDAMYEALCTALMRQCDGSQFDIRTGAVLRGPATEPLATYEVREQDGEIQVRV
jgi:acyl-CoA reductase-like NAD-dependent aldehyde dehydrogenase